MGKEVEQDIKQFCDAWQGINMVYEDYARSIDIPYTSLCILSMLTQTENCTQKLICELTLLPKQTVNTIITGFYKSHFIELRELPEDRRTKTIHLTREGQEYADRVIPHIRAAEKKAMERLSDEQRQALLEGIEIYSRVFREEMMADR